MPMAISKYKEMNFEICAGISKFERTKAANNPNKKNNTTGSSKVEKTSGLMAGISCCSRWIDR